MKPRNKQLIIDELSELLDEFRDARSRRLREGDDTTRADYLARRMEFARGKLDDLKKLKQRDKAVADRRKEIDRDNAKRNKRGAD